MKNMVILITNESIKELNDGLKMFKDDVTVVETGPNSLLYRIGPVLNSVLHFKQNTPLDIFQWLKNVLSFQISGDHKSMISVLTFTPEESDTGKILSCQAENIFFPNRTERDFWTLKVNCK